MGNFGVGLDIGTTTIHAELVDLGTGETIDTFYAFNEQRKFGADVISRIAAAQAGKTGELFSSVNNQVEGLFQHFIKKNNLKKIDKCVVSGNTTMLHLFCGIDPSAMGQAPYTPEFLEERHFAGGELSLSVEQITLLPGISAFLGADITAGLALVDITGQDYNSLSNALFVDIGTNGEIAVWKKSEKRLLCCSTAAGPCFEESHISCGLSASDFVNAIADMRRSGIIDETGAFSNTFANEFTNGYTYAGGVITQKDVRQFQLGKSAIYSGIKMLCKNARLEPAKIDTVYIAGGMGYYLNLENAVEVKLLPSGFTRIKSCGNTSLKGAVKSLTDPAFLSLCREIVFCAETVDLANDKYFAAAFEHNMWF